MFIDIAYASEEAAEVVGHTTETATDAGLLASLGIQPSLFVFQLVNFALVAVILWYLVFKPITKKMGERQKMIDDSIANSQKIESNLARSEKDYQARVDNAKVEANKIVEKATGEALGMAEKMKDKAKIEIEGLVEQARRNIKKDKEAMSSALKAETAEFVVMALEKILNEKIDEKKDRKLIEEMIKKVSSKE